jgi:hypothetical protein
MIEADLPPRNSRTFAKDCSNPLSCPHSKIAVLFDAPLAEELNVVDVEEMPQILLK